MGAWVRLRSRPGPLAALTAGLGDDIPQPRIGRLPAAAGRDVNAGQGRRAAEREPLAEAAEQLLPNAFPVHWSFGPRRWPGLVPVGGQASLPAQRAPPALPPET